MDWEKKRGNQADFEDDGGVHETAAASAAASWCVWFDGEGLVWAQDRDLALVRLGNFLPTYSAMVDELIRKTGVRNIKKINMFKHRGQKQLQLTQN
jgi:hypothetical protein